MLRQGDAEVFKRYSQAKLTMMREALAKLDRNANQHRTSGTAAEHAVARQQGTTPLSVAVADFNNDGRPDLAVANSSGANVLLGNGDGTFQTAASFNAGNSADAVAVGDFNNDGNQDLAVANGESICVSILLGTGTGSFRVPVNYPVGSGPSAVAVADFNNSGQFDLAVTNASDNTVDVLMGEGNGTFEVAANYGLQAVGGPSLWVISMAMARPI
jgi:hypothetical protein